jgi:hypothetical protein
LLLRKTTTNVPVRLGAFVALVTAPALSPKRLRLGECALEAGNAVAGHEQRRAGLGELLLQKHNAPLLVG